MGSEASCTLRLGTKTDHGKAFLETDFLLFRGTERVRIAFSDMSKVVAKDGVLTIDFADKKAKLTLGAGAEKWAEKIRNPKGRIDKLGIKPGAKVVLVGGFDSELRAELAARSARVTEGSRGNAHDHVLFAADGLKDLAGLGKLTKLLAPAGGIWIVYPKGRTEIREADVLAAGRALGLTDVKVARFSEIHTALRFVVPLAKRKA